MSAGLGSLTSKLTELREPPWLTDEDAISIALVIPQIERLLGDSCKVKGSGAERSTRVLFGVSCAGKGVGTVISVDVQNGEATDLDTGRSLQSAKATQVARERLDQIERRKAELRKEVAAGCRLE